MAERFEAWCFCPACETFECHALRAPRAKVWDLDKIRADSPEWSDEAVMRYARFLDRRDGSSEFGFEVIRTCKCGNEWGQV